MPGIVLTVPILPGKVEAWRRFCQELSDSRLRMYEASRRRLGIRREQMLLVDTPFGALAVMTLESNDIQQTLAGLIASGLPFDAWYRERFIELHGISLAGYEEFAQPAPLAPPHELLFEWNSPIRPKR